MWSFGSREYYRDILAILVHPRPMSEQLEGIASDILADSAVGSPVCAFLLADLRGILLTPVGSHEEGFDGRECRFSARNHRIGQATVMRAVAAKELAARGYDAGVSSAVERLARALALPREQFIEDLRSGRGMHYLQERYPHVDAALIGARMADVGALQRQSERVAKLRTLRNQLVHQGHRETGSGLRANVLLEAGVLLAATLLED